MIRTVIRLAPSQAAGKLLSGMLIAGGKSATGAIGVPCSLSVGPVNPPVTVPQFDGVMPANGVIVQQVTMPRTKKKPPIPTAIATTQKIICPTKGRPSLMFLKLILFIEV